ncbi:MAG: helix-turn-helix domain-containing protein [Aristaeellaceae bacterium]
MTPGRGKKKNIYRKYFVSYCCIALIPVIVVSLLVVILSNFYFDRSARDMYQKAISQASAHLDALFQEMQSSVTYFSQDSSISALMAERPGQTQQLTVPVANYLTSIESSCRMEADVLFYLLGDTCLYTPQGAIAYQDYETDMAPLADLNQSRFFTRLNNTAAFTLFPLKAPGQADSGSAGYMAAFFPYYSANAGQRGTFAYIIPVENILSIVESYLGIAPDYLYLYSPQLERISQYEAEEQPETERTRMLRGAVNSITQLNLAGGKYHVLRYRTDLYGIQLVTAIRLDALYGDADRLRAGTLSVILLVTVAALVCALLLARYSYRPIRRLLQAIGPDGAPSGESNEFDLIGTHLAQVHSEVTSLQERLAMQRPMVRDRLLLKVLRGNMDKIGVEQFHSVFPEISLEDPYFYVAIAAAAGKALLHKQPLFEQVSLPGAQCHGVYVEDEQSFAFLIVTASGEDMRQEQCRQLLEAMKQQDILTPQIGAGRIVKGYEEVPHSYLEAYIALSNCRLLTSEADVGIYGVTCGQDSFLGGGLTVPGENDFRLYLQSIQSVDEKAAVQILSGLLERLKISCASVLNASYIRFDLYYRALSVCESQVAQTFGGKSDAIHIFTDEDQFSLLMHELTAANCKAVESKRDSAQQQTRSRILRLLREHCFEPDFSLGRLSELADYSATHINRCLREETGYSFIQLVTNLRMARARQELSGTDDRIKDIVARCGYLDMASFARKFKELEGLTPGEYRQLHRGEAPR